jgi:hypothetical protein
MKPAPPGSITPTTLQRSQSEARWRNQKVRRASRADAAGRPPLPRCAASWLMRRALGSAPAPSGAAWPHPLLPPRRRPRPNQHETDFL